MSVYVLEDIGKREYQEDRHSVEFDLYDGYDFYSIFDGHGGNQVSTFLKLYYKEVLRGELVDHDDPKTALYSSFEIISRILPKNISYHMGSTAIVILRKKNRI